MRNGRFFCKDASLLLLAHDRSSLLSLKQVWLIRPITDSYDICGVSHALMAGLQVNHEDFNEGIIQVQSKKKANLNYYA